MTTPHQILNPTVYVLGFAFDLSNGSYPRVCLIEKKRPTWQAGRLNGVGGKVDPGDQDEPDAMAREFREETGVSTWPSDWLKFFVMRFANGAVIHCYATKIPDDQTPATQEDERVDMYQLGRSGRWFLRRPIIANLNWLIPLAYHELMSEPGERMMI